MYEPSKLYRTKSKQYFTQSPVRRSSFNAYREIAAIHINNINAVEHFLVWHGNNAFMPLAYKAFSLSLRVVCERCNRDGKRTRYRQNIPPFVNGKCVYSSSSRNSVFFRRALPLELARLFRLRASAASLRFCSATPSGTPKMGSNRGQACFFQIFRPFL